MKAPTIKTILSIFAFLIALLSQPVAAFATSGGIDTPEGLTELPVALGGNAGLILASPEVASPQQMPANPSEAPNTFISGNLHVGTTAGQKVLTVNGTVAVLGAATAGNDCSPNGLVAQDGSGILLSCQSGKWKNIGGTSDVNSVLGVNSKWPAYIWCTRASGPDTMRIIYQLEIYDVTAGTYYYFRNGYDNEYVVYYPSGAYYTGRLEGDCSANIWTLCNAGRCGYNR